MEELNYVLFIIFHGEATKKFEKMFGKCVIMNEVINIQMASTALELKNCVKKLKANGPRHDK